MVDNRRWQAASLEFIILKARAIREAISLFSDTLNSIDPKRGPEEAQAKLHGAIHSAKYQELLARCQRLEELEAKLTGATYNQLFYVFGVAPGELRATISDCLRVFKRYAENHRQAPLSEFYSGLNYELPTSAAYLAKVEEEAMRLATAAKIETKPDLATISALEAIPAADQADFLQTFWATCEKVREDMDHIGSDLNKNETVARAQLGGLDALLTDSGRANMVLRESPWFSGSFYLVAFIVILVAIGALQNFVSGWAFPLALVGSILGLCVVGAFQLRNDERLSERSFLILMRLSLGRLIAMLRFWRRESSAEAKKE